MIQQSYKRPLLATRPGFLWRNVKKSWPFAVWLGVAVVCALLYFGYGQFTGITGVVAGHIQSVAPLQTERLLSIEVLPGQHVKAGDLLARMDATLVDAALAADEALILETESSAAGFQQNMLELFMRFAAELSDAEVALEQSRLQHAQDQAQLQELRAELARREELFERQLIEAADVYELRPQIAALERAVEGFPVIERLHTERLEAARAEREELRRVLKLEAGESLAAAIDRKTQARRNLLEADRNARQLERQTYDLRATHDAVVSRIVLTPGVVVQAGEEIMRLVAETPDTVEGFLPEAHQGAMYEGQKARILRPHARTTFDAVVTSIAPEIQTLPDRVSPIRNQPLRGCRVVLSITSPQEDLVPGETVYIRPVRRRLFGRKGRPRP